MKKLIILMLLSVFLIGCNHVEIEKITDSSKTTVAEMEQVKADTTLYKVIVEKNSISVFNKDTNIKEYKVEDFRNVLSFLGFVIIGLLIILLIISLFNSSN